MKKLILLVAFSAASLATQAQLSIGARGGLNFATTTQKASSGTEKSSNLGLNVGAIFNIGINDMFSIQPELAYTVKGDKVTFGSDNYFQTSMSYLELPVLAKLSFGGESFKFFVNAGPSLGLFMGGSTKAKVGSTEVSADLTDAQKDNINKIDLGIIAGVGASYKVGPGSIFVDFRYNLGLTKTNKTSATGVDDTFLRTPGVNIGYLFPLGGE